MCELTFATFAISTAVATAAGLYSTDAKVKAQKYERNIAVQQAEKARTDAAYERQSGIEDARTQRLQAILNMGEEKASIASGNISVNSQTALNIIDDAKLNGELDALNTLKKSEKRANDYLFSSEQQYSNIALNSFKSKTTNIGNSLNSISQDVDTFLKLL